MTWVIGAMFIMKFYLHEVRSFVETHVSQTAIT